ncbi:hypothetical protein EZV62_001267 [Acer yangbiense]|uniref:Myb/SANT-like domain-containing protein n=1 Tax=Acer yangbiense TaxID=1000413 RepID=A0A5C7IUB6_9ROSI|nr:hypothetical protein EZV62_001267 [Acer yangbiense]
METSYESLHDIVSRLVNVNPNESSIKMKFIYNSPEVSTPFEVVNDDDVQAGVGDRGSVAVKNIWKGVKLLFVPPSLVITSDLWIFINKMLVIMLSIWAGKFDMSDKRNWTLEEKDIMITILEKVVADSGRCDNGSFRSGTYEQVASKMREKIEKINITEKHVQNKIKRMKDKYSVAYDMLNMSGFGWDDTNKCVTVDSLEILKEHLKGIEIKSSTIHGSDTSLENAVNNVKEVGVGDLFPSKEELHMEINLLAIAKHFQFKMNKSTKALLVLTSNVEDCKWHVRATKLKDCESFRVRKYESDHTCSLDALCFDHRQASSILIGHCIK